MIRTFIHVSLIVIVTGILSGCGSSQATKHASAATQAEKVTGTKTYVMKSSGVDVLKVTASPDDTCITEDGSLHFNKQRLNEVEFWLVPAAKTVDEAAGKVGTQIKTEFEEFKPDHITNLTIAGSPAKRLVGHGKEADDGDDGSADVIVFKVGDRIFVACTHGEALDPLAQQRMLAMVQTAQKP